MHHHRRPAVSGGQPLQNRLRPAPGFLVDVQQIRQGLGHRGDESLCRGRVDGMNLVKPDGAIQKGLYRLS